MGHANSSFTSLANTLGLERRVCFRADVTRRFISVDLGDENGGLLLDLSKTGAAIQAVARLHAGNHTPFSFALPSRTSRVVEGRAVVAWVGASGLLGGIRFEGMSPASREELQRWLDRSKAPEALGRAFVFASPAQPRAPLPPDPAPAPAPRPGRNSPTPPGALADLGHHARILTGADGAGVVLRRTSGQFVCVYSDGMAPEVGCTVRTDRGLSAECITTVRTVTCDNAAQDPRVNPGARGALGSAVIVPVLHNAGKPVIGLLAVFSRREKAFRPSHVEDLQSLAAAIAIVANDRFSS